MKAILSNNGKLRWEEFHKITKDADPNSIIVISGEATMQDLQGLIPEGAIFVQVHNPNLCKASTLATQSVIQYNIKYVVLHTSSLSINEAQIIEKTINNFGTAEVILLQRCRKDSKEDIITVLEY